MIEQLKYSILKDDSAFSLKHVQKFIEEQDISFKPKISEKVSIPAYANKLYTHGIIIICQSADKIIGLSAFYCQPADYEYSFLSYLAVNTSYRGKGIAKKLVSLMIEYCKEQNMKGIKTSTWKGNRAVSLYLSFGFIIAETNDNERVELILNF